MLPPDINESGKFFTVTDDGKIRFGFAAIKDVGDAAIDAILKEREKGKFKSIEDFVGRVDSSKVNRKVLERLIKAGAFDSFGIDRGVLYKNLDKILEKASKKKVARPSVLSFVGLKVEEGTEKLEGEGWSAFEKLKYEKESVGFFISGHPLDLYEDDLKRLGVVGCGKVELNGRESVSVAGVVRSVKELSTKKGDRMGILTVEDKTGSIEVVLFPELFKKIYFYIDPLEPFYFRGRLDGDEDGVRLVAEEVEFLKEAMAKEVKEVELSIDARRFSVDDVDKLRELISRFRGKVPVVFRIKVPGEGTVIMRAGGSFRVDPGDDLKSSLEELLGKGSIRFL